MVWEENGSQNKNDKNQGSMHGSHAEMEIHFLFPGGHQSICLSPVKYTAPFPGRAYTSSEKDLSLKFWKISPYRSCGV
jgi:hypothetical protein